jgi:hypothetical protein
MRFSFARGDWDRYPRFHVVIELTDHIEAGVTAVIRLNVDPLYICMLRAAMRPADDRVHSIRIAMHRSFYRAIVEIAHPTCDPESLRFMTHRVAEEHALHAAMNN